MTKLTSEQVYALSAPLPDWAIKQHPTKKSLSVIHPMAVVDRLNDVFGVGGWHFSTDYISCEKEIQIVAVYDHGRKTDETRERTVYTSAVKGHLYIEEYDISLEQFGGSTNDDRGDALKGGATDALTKIASYLGIGASIYKGQGNGKKVAIGHPAFDDDLPF